MSDTPSRAEMGAWDILNFLLIQAAEHTRQLIHLEDRGLLAEGSPRELLGHLEEAQHLIPEEG